MNDAKQIKEYLDKQFKKMKHVREVSRREQNQQEDKEIAEALKEINKKYFASALEKKGPNLQIQKVLDMTYDKPKTGAKRQDSNALSKRSGYVHSPRQTLERQLTGTG